jgi:hypothetical protein
VEQERFICWGDDGSYRTFASFKAAEKWARRHARPGNEIEITHGFHPVATVRADALDRIWTDVIDATIA